MGVTVDEDEIGSLVGDQRPDRALHRQGIRGAEIEPVLRLGQRELLEEHLRERAVVVLAGVDDDLVDPASRNAADSGAALMNCGLFPTTVSTFMWSR